MIAYCPHGQEDQAVTAVTRNETYPVCGEPITVTARVAVCSTCQHDVSIMALDDATLMRAYALHRQRHGLGTSAS